jgi:hypothetical protein
MAKNRGAKERKSESLNGETTQRRKLWNSDCQKNENYGKANKQNGENYGTANNKTAKTTEQRITQ